MYRTYKCCVIGLIALLLFIPLTEAGLEDGLVLYLPFDEGNGDVARDLSENNFTGTITGAKWDTGKFGSALRFDGDGDFVELEFNDAFDIKEGITMAAWVTGNIPFNPEWRVIINAKKSAQGPWGLQTRASANLETYYDIAGTRVWTSSISTMEADVFHHVGGAYDKGDGFRVYFDGKLEEGGANSGGLGTRGELNTPPAESIAIGHNYNEANRWWDGAIDEVVVYNRALSEGEMAKLFESPPIGKPVDPKAKLAVTWGAIKIAND